MTQHSLNDIVYDLLQFDPDECAHEDFPDFRGLTCCQAGRLLQGA